MSDGIVRRIERFRLVAVSAVVSMVGIACSGPGGEVVETIRSVDAVSSTGISTADVSGVATPVSVTATIDESASVETEISPNGGVISVENATGTTFTVSFPAGAVTKATTVTMTPVDEVDGVDGFIAGVELFPDGLILETPALLTFTAPGLVAVLGWASANGYAWDHPYVSEGDTVRVPLFGFSGYGAFSTPGVAPEACSNVDTFRDLRAALGAAALGLATGSQSDFDPSDQVESIVQLYDCQAKPLLERSQSDDKVFEVAGRSYLRFKSMAQLLGVDADAEIASRIEEGNGLATSALAFALDSANRRCFENIDRAEAVAIAGLGGWAPYFEAADDPSVGAAAVVERLRRCLSFEFDITLTDHFDMEEVFVIDESVAATVPFTFDDGLELSGSAPARFTGTGYERGLEILELAAQGLGPMVGVEVPNNLTTTDHYTCGFAPADGEASIFGQASDLAGPDPDIHLTVAFSENPAVVGPCTAPGAEPIDPFDFPTLLLESLPDLFPEFYPDGTLELSDWKPGTGPVIGTKNLTADLSEAGAIFTASLDATIRHTPKP